MCPFCTYPLYGADTNFVCCSCATVCNDMEDRRFSVSVEVAERGECVDRSLSKVKRVVLKVAFGESSSFQGDLSDGTSARKNEKTILSAVFPFYI